MTFILTDIGCDDPNQELLCVGNPGRIQSCNETENTFGSLTGSEGTEEGCFCK